jgi:hypothetical protein
MEEEAKITKKSFIWDTEKKRPSKYFFFILIVITISILSWAIVDLITETHEIKFVIDYNGNWDAEIEFEGNYEYIEGSGHREVSYRVTEGTFLSIMVYPHDSNSRYITVEIYDDGNRVRDGKWSDTIDSIFLEYTVGE